MHACLNVDEIVRLIACELVASEANAAVVYFACCCKNFEGPVLDVLWETQGKLFPLFKSLPENVRKEGGCTVSAPITHVFFSLDCLVWKAFKISPTTLEWARFRKYARRMRKVKEHWISDILSSEVFQVL